MERRLIFPEPWHVDYGAIDHGQLEPDQALVRTRVSGISHGTELTAFTGASPFVTRTFNQQRYFQDKAPGDWVFYPYWYAGYDCVGIIESAGPAVNRFKTGDRVWYPTQHQTSFTVRESDPLAIKLPEAVADEEAAMLNLASIALCAVYDAQIQVGDVVVVFGAGVVGQLVTQCALLGGARRVFVVEPLAVRRTLAAQLTTAEPIDPAARLPVEAVLAFNGGCWPDAVIETSGRIEGLSSAVQTAGFEGTVIAAGFYCGKSDALCLGEEFLHNRVTIKASMSKWGCSMRYSRRWDEQRLLQEALHLIAKGRLVLAPLISARFPFDQGQRAYDCIARDPQKHLKVLFDYPQPVEPAQQADCMIMSATENSAAAAASKETSA